MCPPIDRALLSHSVMSTPYELSLIGITYELGPKEEELVPGILQTDQNC